MIAAPGSGHGKTLISAAIARYLTRQGKRVQVFKIGPDYLDPGILETASGRPVLNLDLWMMGEVQCRNLLASAAQQVDVVLVESVMGLHDNLPSNAKVANLLGLAMALVINVAKFAQTVSAIVEGMVNYDVGIELLGVVGNRVASDNHHRLVSEAIGQMYAGSMRRDDAFEIPSRHLGLVQADEIHGLDQQLDEAATSVADIVNYLQIPLASFKSTAIEVPKKYLAGKVIAIARDSAFSFIYPQNLEALEIMGAELKYFSVLNDDPLPDCDAIWLPGGYPELHLQKLSEARQVRFALSNHLLQSKPLLAECGGMIAMSNRIQLSDNSNFTGFGLFAANCKMESRFQSVGLQQVNYGLTEEDWLKGHSFHHSRIETDDAPWRYGIRQDGEKGEAVFRIKTMTLSYMHHYFPSNYQAAARLFGFQG